MPPHPIARARCIPITISTAISTPRRLPQHPPTLSTQSRSLTTTTPKLRQTPSHRTVPASQLPDYPYGRFRTYKQRNEGLFGRSKILFGNVVAPRYKNKSRTTWLPNRQTKRLWSPALNAFIRTRMTASILHTIDLLGGIDEYLLGSKAKRIKELGPAGWALRWKIIQTPAVQARFAAQRALLGLPPKESAAFPAELAARGLDSGTVLDEVDGMIARDEEFVIGDAAAEAGGSVVVEGGKDSTPQVQKSE